MIITRRIPELESSIRKEKVQAHTYLRPTHEKFRKRRRRHKEKLQTLARNQIPIPPIKSKSVLHKVTCNTYGI